MASVNLNFIGPQPSSSSRGRPSFSASPGMSVASLDNVASFVQSYTNGVRDEVQRHMAALRENLGVHVPASAQQRVAEQMDDSTLYTRQAHQPTMAAAAASPNERRGAKRQQSSQESLSQNVEFNMAGGVVYYTFSPTYHNALLPQSATAASGHVVAGAASQQSAPLASSVHGFTVSPPSPPLLLTSPYPIRLLLVRHGESKSNTAPHLIAGQSNHIPLTARGRQQAAALATTLQQRRYHSTLVLVSDAVRCQQTLAALQLDPPPHSQYTSLQLREQSQGQWEGLLRANVHTAKVKAAMKQHTTRFSAPGGESIADTANRAYAFIMQAITREAPAITAVHGAVDVLVVCHGQVIRGLVWLLCGMRDEYVWRLGCDNCSMTELHIDTEGVRLARLNDACHLQALPAAEGANGSIDRANAASSVSLSAPGAASATDANGKPPSTSAAVTVEDGPDSPIVLS